MQVINKMADQKFSIENIIKSGEVTSVDPKNFIQFDVNIPKELAELYEKLGDCLKTIKIGRWHILSPLEAMVNNFTFHNQKEVTLYDFAMTYEGLGWALVASIDLTNGQVFIRLDGGSNGYDVDANLKKILAYRKNAHKYVDKLISFEKFIQLCSEEEMDDTENLQLNKLRLW